LAEVVFVLQKYTSYTIIDSNIEKNKKTFPEIVPVSWGTAVPTEITETTEREEPEDKNG